MEEIPFLAQPPAKVIFRAMDCAKPVPHCSGKRSLTEMMAEGNDQLSPPQKVACKEPPVTPAPTPTPTPGLSPRVKPSPAYEKADTTQAKSARAEDASGDDDDWNARAAEGKAQAKAARADDAPVDEDEWNERAAEGIFEGGFDNSFIFSHAQGF